jgi:maleate cis-trans isomerase
MLEYEWPSHLPREVLFPLARIRMRGASAADYAEIAQAAPAAAEDLVSAGADVVAYACSVGSLFAGATAEDRLIAALGRASGKPAVSIADASVRALRRLGASHVAIMTPYNAQTNALVSDYARQRGLTVAAEIGMPVGIAEIANLSAAEIARLAMAAMAGLPQAQALWIPCTAVRTLDAIDSIEAATGRAVVSGSQALLWAALRAIGIEERLDCGQLLRRH